MLSFILGAPGSGKTEEIIKRISGALSGKKKALLIVPEQEAVSAERRITQSAHGLSEFFSLEIVNFRRLSNVVFRTLGGLCYNYIDKAGQAVIMWRVLSELSPFLKNFRIGQTTDTELISSLIALFDEFADYRVSAVDFENLCPELPQPLKSKAEDISVIYTRYDELIHEGFDSKNDDLAKVAQLLRKNSIFSDTEIFIDSFAGFTPAEYELLRELMNQAANMTVSLCIDPLREAGVFANLYDTKKTLCNIAKELNVPVGEDMVLEYNGAEEFIFFEKYAFDNLNAPEYPDSPCNITLMPVSDKYRECEIAAADIAKHIRKGMRYRDFRIVLGSSEEYAGIIDSVLSRHSIPYHFSVSEDILQKPLVKLVLSALNIVTYNWRLSDVISCLKTGMSVVSDEECDIIEEYASTWSLSGSVWKSEFEWNMNPMGYTDKTTRENGELLCRVNCIRDKFRMPLLKLSESISAKCTGADAAKAIYEYLCDNVSPESLQGEEIPVWNALIGALEQLSLCANDAYIDSPDTAKRLLRLILSQTAYTRIPSAVDEVGVGEAGSFRGGGAERIYFIGINDGVFPRAYKDETVFPEGDRKILAENGLKLSNDPCEMETEQLWLFWRAFLCARQSVFVSWCTNTLDGSECLPSLAVYELQRLFPASDVMNFDDIAPGDLIYDLPSALDNINTPDLSLREMIRDILKESPEYSQIASSLNVPVSTVCCSLKDPENLKLFSGDLNLTQTRIDSFVHCKFAYELQYVLKLKEQRKVRYDPRDVGNFIHVLLERYFSLRSKAENSGEKFTKEASEKLVRELVDSYIEATCGTTSFISKRMYALFDRLRRHALVFISDIEKEFENSNFKPGFFELPISRGTDNALEPYRVELSDKTGAYIYGQIDRVDTFEKNGKVYFRIVDYKTGSKEFKREDLERGLNLQMFLYLFSVMKNKEKFSELLGCRGELVPCGVIYYMARLTQKTYDAILPDEEIFLHAVESVKRQGMVFLDDTDQSATGAENETPDNPEIILTDSDQSMVSVYSLAELGKIEETISQTLKRIGDEIKRGNADAVPMESHDSPCSNCRMRAVCRRNPAEEE